MSSNVENTEAQQADEAGLTADNEPETLKAQAFSVGQSEYSGQVNDAVRSSATATEFLATDGNPVLQGGEDVIRTVFAA